MIRKISAELVPLTHELTTRISTMPSLPGERDQKPARLKFFQDHLKEGTFCSPTWSIAVLKGNKQELRADGQHTSSVLAAVDPSQFPNGLKVTLQRFELDDLANDAAQLFDMFDNPQSVRTNTDAMNIHRAHFDELKTLAAPFLVKVANGIDFYLRDLPSTSEQKVLVHRSRRHGLYFSDEQNRQFAIWLYQWHEAKYSWMLSKPGLVAEMLADWKASSNLATTFWGYVIQVNHPDVNHETRELADTLKEWATKAKFKQIKFRNRAKRVWERYWRLEQAERHAA